MRGAKLVLAVVLVFGTASVAAAECAWLLWGDRHSYGWQWYEAFETKADCTTARMNQMQKHAKKVREKGAAYVEVDREERTLTFVLRKGDGTERRKVTYHCLPSTFDPREKKE